MSFSYYQKEEQERLHSALNNHSQLVYMALATQQNRKNVQTVQSIKNSIKTELLKQSNGDQVQLGNIASQSQSANNESENEDMNQQQMHQMSQYSMSEDEFDILDDYEYDLEPEQE